MHEHAKIYLPAASNPRHEVPEKYEHGKPFCYGWQLQDGPPTLNKLHGWIIDTMKLGIASITVYIPRWVFSAHVDHKICINFKDLH
jgi:hypothetical protein